MTNDGHRGDAWKPALMTMADIADLLDVQPSRIRSSRKHMRGHPEPAIRVRKTDYFHTHSFHEYMANGNPIGDLRAVEQKLRRGYLAGVKRSNKKRVVRNTINRAAPLTSFNVARAW